MNTRETARETGPIRETGLAGTMIPRTTTRAHDQRGDARYDGLVREAVLSARGREQLVRVVNISAEGAMIVPAPPLRIGEALSLRLPGELRVEASVRWIRGEHMGVVLTTPLLIRTP